MLENAIVNDISNILQRPSSSITKPNLKPHLSTALKSLQRQKNTLKITRADKGNATVIMTQKQYYDKILEHLDLDCYTPLNKDPTDSLNRKLDSVLKKLLKLKENKIKSTNPFSIPVGHPTLEDLNSMDSQKSTNQEIPLDPLLLSISIIHLCHLYINNFYYSKTSNRFPP